MKRLSLVLGIGVCLGLVAVTPSVLACGDKIVDISQGVKFQRATSLQAATIVLYIDADQIERPVKRLRASLARVGHDVELISDRKVALDALRDGEVDLVIAELAEVAFLESMLASGSSPPRVIPFFLDGTDAELEKARGEYSYVLSLPGKDNELILTVHEALRAQASVSTSTI